MILAAAVILDPANPIEGLKDSKALTEKRRIVLDEEIRQRAIAYCVARAEVHEIDAINILHASMLAMQRAVAGLSVKPEYAIVDGNRSPAFECPSDWLIKGDTKHDSIKAASIIAKVARDHEMIELDAVFPQYGFAQHKGYPTRMHLSALSKFGPTEIHRMSFRPCREALKQNE